MMTRKDFVQIAKTISLIKNKRLKEVQIKAWTEICQQSNPRFDKSKFLEACNVLSSPKKS